MALEACSRALAAAYDWRRELVHAMEAKDEQQLSDLLGRHRGLTQWHSTLRGLEQYCHGYRNAQLNVVHRSALRFRIYQHMCIGADTLIGPDSFMDGCYLALSFGEWQSFYTAAAPNCAPRAIPPYWHSTFALSLFGAVRGHLMLRARELLADMRLVEACVCCKDKAAPRFVSSLLTAVMSSRRLVRAAYRNICADRLRHARQHMPHALAAGRWQVCVALSRLSPPYRAVTERWLHEQAFAAQPAMRTPTCMAALLCRMIARRFRI